MSGWADGLSIDRRGDQVIPMRYGYPGIRPAETEQDPAEQQRYDHEDQQDPAQPAPHLAQAGAATEGR
ncbi:MAG: hypothetical protein HC828_01845 [Blastochloris sp.]|nr:hypothetical protein [Blastochloris sp.]